MISGAPQKWCGGLEMGEKWCQTPFFGRSFPGREDTFEKRCLTPFFPTPFPGLQHSPAFAPAVFLRAARYLGSTADQGAPMSTTKYTADHEWVRLEDDETVTIGITQYAQEQLGDIVFVQLPDVGSRLGQGDEAVVIESVKAAADIKMPLAGEIVAVNDALGTAPETVNSDPMGAGWFLRVRPDDRAALDALLDQAAYEKLTAEA